MEDFAAVVVTYFPNKEIISKLHRYAETCTLLVVVDNTDSGADLKFKDSNIILISNEKNIGLAAALNKGIQVAGQKGYENIFLFDQDTYVDSSYFIEMIEYKNRKRDVNGITAIYVPNFWDRNSRTFARFILLTTFTLDHACCHDFSIKYKKQAVIAITSGTCLIYSAYKQLGPLKDEYFIDAIDHEYCLRAASKGFRIHVNCDLIINHSIGKRSLHQFFGITVKPNFHPPVRKYYFARNILITAIDYFSVLPSYSLLVFAHIIHEFISIVFFEKNKISKLKAIVYGLIHGLIKRKGECKLSFST